MRKEIVTGRQLASMMHYHMTYLAPWTKTGTERLARGPNKYPPWIFDSTDRDEWIERKRRLLEIIAQMRGK